MGTSLISQIRTRLANCPDSEPEQAGLRVIICTFVMAYLYSAGAFESWRTSSLHLFNLWFMSAIVCFSWTVLIAIAITPHRSVPRRILVMFVDLAATSYGMGATGPLGAPLYVVYLWVTFGNGFRYGNRYLLGGTILSFLGFSLVIVYTPYWQTNIVLGIGLLTGIVLLPAYVSTLISRLNEATTRAEEANRAKSRFLANMSHEIRTPLNGVVGMAELLATSRLSGEQNDFVQTIQASAKTLLALVEDILDISKIEEGKIVLESTELDLHRVVSTTVKMLAPQATKKKLHTKVSFDADVPFGLVGDPLHLRQVLINIIGNAIKFTEQGGIHIKISTVSRDNHKVHLLFEVVDTGIGISEAAQPSIFESFVQADKSMTRRYGGTGLGTAISKQLVELMGGEIGVTSSPGHGSRFWFTLVFDLARTDAMVSTALEQTNVLVLSRDTLDRRGIRKSVSDWGARVEVSATLGLAIEWLGSAAMSGTPYQALIIDYPSAGIDDPTQLPNLVAQNAQITDLSIIFVGHEGAAHVDDTALHQAGYSCVLRIPLNKTFLFNALHAASSTIAREEGIALLIDRFSSKSSKGQSFKILVAEDNKTNQEVVSKILQMGGYEVHMVSDGQQALDALETTAFDLAILDMHMPMIDGLDVIKIHRFSNDSGNLPFIVLTADATTASREDCKNAGVNEYLTKPITAEKLLGAVASVRATNGTAHILKFPSEDCTIDTPTSSNYFSESYEGRLDQSKLDELITLTQDIEFITELVNNFLLDAKEVLGSMHTSLQCGRYDEFREHAHAVRGSAGTMGATALEDLAARACRMTSQELITHGESLFAQMREALQLSRAELGRYVKRTSGVASI